MKKTHIFVLVFFYLKGSMNANPLFFRHVIKNKKFQSYGGTEEKSGDQDTSSSDVSPTFHQYWDGLVWIKVKD